VYVKFCNLVLLILSWEGVWGREQHLLPRSNPVERLCVFPPKMEFGSGRAKKFAFITP
jgi:hypothetical protein